MDEEDFNKYKHVVAWLQPNGYVGLFLRGRKVLLHRAIMDFPSDDVDHINLIKLDNRKVNLRACSRSQNMANSGARSTNTSGYKGVSWVEKKNKWRASIRVNYTSIHIGYYKLKEEAAKAYNLAALKHFGDFAYLNTIPGDSPK